MERLSTVCYPLYINCRTAEPNIFQRRAMGQTNLGLMRLMFLTTSSRNFNPLVLVFPRSEWPSDTGYRVMQFANLRTTDARPTRQTEGVICISVPITHDSRKELWHSLQWVSFWCMEDLTALTVLGSPTAQNSVGSQRITTDIDLDEQASLNDGNCSYPIRHSK